MKKIDYFKLLRESLKFVWKYKILWVLGFLIALFSGGVSNGNINYSNDSNLYRKILYQEDDYLKNITDKIASFIHLPYFWILLIAAIIFILVLVAISWYLSRVSKIALINSIKYDLLGQEKNIKLSYLWKSSHKYLLKMLYFDLIMFAFSLPFIFGISFPFIYSLFGDMERDPDSWICSCCGLPIAVLGLLIWSIVYSIAEKFIVLGKESIKETIRMSIDLFNKNIKKYILASLVISLPGCSFIFITYIIYIVQATFLKRILELIIINPSSSLINIGLGGCIGIFIMLVIAIIDTPFIVFYNTYWTKFLILIKGQDLEDKDIKECIVVKKSIKKGMKK